MPEPRAAQHRVLSAADRQAEVRRPVELGENPAHGLSWTVLAARPRSPRSPAGSCSTRGPSWTVLADGEFCVGTEG